MARLDNKITIITGATSGIGQRTAELFVAEGAQVVLVGRRAAEGAQIAAALGERAQFVQADVTEEDQVAGLFADALARYGRIDCVFNNAGCPAPRGPIESIPLAEHRAAMAVLVDGVMLGMKYAAPIMKRQGAGSIINNASVAAHRAGLSSSTIYSAAKAAVLMMSRCVAMELGEHGIRVNTISPGAIATGIFAKAMGMADATAADATAARLHEHLKGAQPIPRAGLPEDIAQAALYFASDQSSFVNGADLLVDGGVTAGRRWPEQQAAIKGFREAFGITD